METQDRDVTALVEFRDNDSEALPLTRCVCDAEFDAWDFILSIYRDMARRCPKCGRRLYFTNTIRVYEVANANHAEAPSNE